MRMFNSDWIPCNERLPDESGEYLVTIKEEDSFVTEAWFWKDTKFLCGERPGWKLLNEWYQFNDEMREKIIAWMPYPKAYEEKGFTDNTIYF